MRVYKLCLSAFGPCRFRLRMQWMCELRGVGNGPTGRASEMESGAEKIGRIIRMSERMSGERAFDVFSNERKMKIHAEQTEKNGKMLKRNERNLHERMKGARCRSEERKRTSASNGEGRTLKKRNHT